MLALPLGLQQPTDMFVEPEDTILLKTCLTLYKKHDSWPQAMQVRLLADWLFLDTPISAGRWH
jgi:hypothetical protein